ncbi:hypothetical protein COXBURSA334_1631 [Coxiella burnetii Q321]|nr:hypothetical protein COXBURSA334_1631 [Coxiella burnetii Q321]
MTRTKRSGGKKIPYSASLHVGYIGFLSGGNPLGTLKFHP